MTTAEAIKEINSGIELELANRCDADLTLKYIEALELAIEALRKQEAVKPKACHVEPMYDGWHFQGYVQTKSGGVAKHHFCSNCGQAIDWEEDEEE